MSIRVNIANQVRQTTVLAWRPLLPLFEAVVNSFQAINEAKLPANIPGRITVEVIRRTDQLALDVPPISGFRVTDNGIGLDDRNWELVQHRILSAQTDPRRQGPRPFHMAQGVRPREGREHLQG